VVKIEAVENAATNRASRVFKFMRRRDGLSFEQRDFTGKFHRDFKVTGGP
jgi:hypothetical protein